jgi:hypothetical protein
MGTLERTNVPEYSFHHITVQRSLSFEEWRGEKKKSCWDTHTHARKHTHTHTLVLGRWVDTSVWYMESIQVVNFYTLLARIWDLRVQAYWDITSPVVNINWHFVGTYSMYRVSLPSLSFWLWRWKPDIYIRNSVTLFPIPPEKYAIIFRLGYHRFPGMFTWSLKALINLAMSVRLSIRMSSIGEADAGKISLKFDVGEFYENLLMNSKLG